MPVFDYVAAPQNNIGHTDLFGGFGCEFPAPKVGAFEMYAVQVFHL